MRRVVAALGWAWFLGPLFVLAVVAWRDLHAPFLNFGYYFAVWGGLLALSLCGGWFLVGIPGAKWMLRVAALLVMSYAGLVVLLSDGGAVPSFYWLSAAVIGFCAATFFLASRRAT
jgi:hypothetical protein